MTVPKHPGRTPAQRRALDAIGCEQHPLWFAVGVWAVLVTSGYTAGLFVGRRSRAAQLAALSRKYANLDAEAVDLRTEAERLREEVDDLDRGRWFYYGQWRHEQAKRVDLMEVLANTYVRKGNRFVRWAAAGVYPAVERGPEGQTGSKTGQEAPLVAQKVADTERTVEEATHAHDPGIKLWEAAEWKTRPLPNPTIAASRISASTIPVHASDDPDRGRYAGLDRGEPMQRGVEE